MSHTVLFVRVAHHASHDCLRHINMTYLFNVEGYLPLQERCLMVQILQNEQIRIVGHL